MDLKEIAGISAVLDVDGSLSFPDIPDGVKASERLFSAAKDYYYDETHNNNKILYRVYRDVCLPEHKELISSNNLRYDMVSISPGKIGREFIKTIGHYHPKADGNEAYPEIYEVLHGSAILLLQDENIADAIEVYAEVGAKVLIPPGYGHITINPGNEYLVFSNIISNTFTSVYGLMEKNHGGVYYYIEENGIRKWMKNPFYNKHPELKTLETGQMPMIAGLIGPLLSESNRRSFQICVYE
ncbi:MAG: glucose-6-phosphate isomerase family protein [Caldisericia bacterium]